MKRLSQFKSLGEAGIKLIELPLDVLAVFEVDVLNVGRLVGRVFVQQHRPSVGQEIQLQCRPLHGVDDGRKAAGRSPYLNRRL